MSLRSKLLFLFATLAVAPLIALGSFEFVRSEHAARELLSVQTTSIASRIASDASDRIDALRANLGFLARNEDVQRVLRTRNGVAQAAAFVDAAARRMGGGFGTLSYTDQQGAEIMRVETGDAGAARRMDSEPPAPAARHRITIAIGDDGTKFGAMTTSVALDAWLPAQLFDAKVGIGGYTVLVNRHTRTVMMGAAPGAGIDRALAAADSAASSDTTISVRFADNDSERVASVVPLRVGELAVVTTASVGEFAGPMKNSRATDLALALAVAAAMAAAFAFLSRRLTRPLESLTAAAGRVGRGIFDPPLPPETSDEIGQLAAAFRLMGGKISDMMHQVEASRQMAAVGAFASQIAHEIRNPLTSIKLNMQSVQRGIANDTASPFHRPIVICLREIDRLDGVVRGVLQLGRETTPRVDRISTHEVIRESQELMRAQLTAQRIVVSTELNADCDTVVGNAEALRGVLLNLFLNAADVLPDGGTIHIASSTALASADTVRITVSDSGPGIAPEHRERVFEPFFTRKRGGSGLGLTVAARDVEMHRGRLALSPAPAALGGAEFTIDLPLARERDA